MAIDNPDKPAMGKDEKSTVIIYNLSSYFLQFWTKSPLAPDLGPEKDWETLWANCTNHTTAGRSSLRMCL
jgi:hypothetical protein